MQPCFRQTAATALVLITSVVYLQGCAVTAPRMATEGADYGHIAPAAGPLAPTMASPMPTTNQAYYPQPMAQQAGHQGAYQGLGSPAFMAQEQAIVEQKQRLERIEQALLRLDKRMQLVERNELGRMSGDGATFGLGLGPTAQMVMPQQPVATLPFAAPAYPTAATDEAMAGTLANAVQGALYQDNIQPVSNRLPDTAIRGTLQAAPHTLGQGLPSLADPRSNNQPMPHSAGQLAVWTVRYEPNMVWPDRAQLPASREVVDALRGSNTMTLVARGPNPTSKAFQDRVRALSRYLAKVASLDTVPIATLATPGLDANTIELLATP